MQWTVECLTPIFGTSVSVTNPNKSYFKLANIKLYGYKYDQTYQQFENFCVDQNMAPFKTLYRKSGDENMEKCKEECNK